MKHGPARPPDQRTVLFHSRALRPLPRTAIGQRLHVSQSAVEKHVNTIFDKLRLSHVTGYSLRILAILRYLDA